MAIRNVVTRGFGSGAEIPFVVTRGYSIAEVLHGYLTASAIQVRSALDGDVALTSALTAHVGAQSALDGKVTITPAIDSDIEMEP